MIGTSPNFHSFFTAPKVSSKIQIPSRAAVDAAVENGLCPKNQPANFGLFNPSNPRVPKNQTPKQIRSNSKNQDQLVDPMKNPIKNPIKDPIKNPIKNPFKPHQKKNTAVDFSRSPVPREHRQDPGACDLISL